MAKKNKLIAKKKCRKHQWGPASFEDFYYGSSDKLKCQRCGATKTCDHKAGETIRGMRGCTGCRHCKLCGKYLGVND